MVEVIEMYQGIPSDWVYHRGDIYIANLNPYTGAEQGGIRPVVVLQNNIGNLHSPTVGNLKKPSIVVLEQIRTIDKSRVHRYVGRLSPMQMDLVDRGIRKSLGLDNEPEYDDAS